MEKVGDYKEINITYAKAFDFPTFSPIGETKTQPNQPKWIEVHRSDGKIKKIVKTDSKKVLSSFQFEWFNGNPVRLLNHPLLEPDGACYQIYTNDTIYGLIVEFQVLSKINREKDSIDFQYFRYDSAKFQPKLVLAYKLTHEYSATRRYGQFLPDFSRKMFAHPSLLFRADWSANSESYISKKDTTHYNIRWTSERKGPYADTLTKERTKVVSLPIDNLIRYPRWHCDSSFFDCPE